MERKERKVGEIFIDSTGKKVKTCLRSYVGCVGCIYKINPNRCVSEYKHHGDCTKLLRSDNQDIIFKEEPK